MTSKEPSLNTPLGVIFCRRIKLMQKLKLMPKITGKMHELAVTSSFRINFVLPMIKHQFFGEL